MKRILDTLLQRQRVPRGEEHALLHSFFGHSEDGVYVDVGANEPFEGSTSWPLEQAGWSGVLVEPIPRLADALRESRQGRVFNCACSNRDRAGTTQTLHVHSGNPGWSSFHKERSPWLGENAEEIEVEVRTLDDILEEAKVPEGFELLAMDVEFHEVEVLEGFDLERWKPQLVFVEDHAYDHTLLRHLVARGYKFVRRTSLNSWFVPEESEETPSTLERYAFFRKYYLGLPARRLKRKLRGILAGGRVAAQNSNSRCSG
ncbi:MAG: FkbM family methyltransferase [Verrucomicrobiales bacterium]